MEQSNELKRLMAEKRELEKRIHQLTSGCLIHETVKVDKIGFAGLYQRGKWALFYKYAYIADRYKEGQKNSARWHPMINGDSMEEVVNRIPEVINALTALYEEAKNHEPDT